MKTTTGDCMRVGGGYISRAFAPVADIATEAADELRDVDYDTMVGTGLSGALVVPRLAETLGKKWMVVRKPNDGSHSSQRGEGHLGKRWLFVDDFISSGTTYFRVCKAVEGISARFGSEHVGSYLYERVRFEPPRTEPQASLKIGNKRSGEWLDTVLVAESTDYVEKAIRRRRKFTLTRIVGPENSPYEVKPSQIRKVESR